MDGRPTASRARQLGVLAAVMLCVSPADAANGSIRCRGADSAGRRVDGTCSASGPGGAHGSCVTAGGTCTIGELAPGSYSVTLRTMGGRTSAARTVQVDSGASPVVVLTAEAGAAATFEASGPSLTVQGRSDAGADAGTSAADARDDAGEAREADAGGRVDAGSSSGTGGTVAGGDGGTVVAREAGAAEAVEVTAVRHVVGTTTAVSPPDRSTGTTLALQGRASDARGRAVDGTVTVSSAGAAVGRAVTSAGRYRLYDLPHGTLTLTFRSLSGATGTATVDYSGAAATVNLSVP